MSAVAQNASKNRVDLSPLSCRATTKAGGAEPFLGASGGWEGTVRCGQRRSQGLGLLQRADESPDRAADTRSLALQRTCQRPRCRALQDAAKSLPPRNRPPQPGDRRQNPDIRVHQTLLNCAVVPRKNQPGYPAGYQKAGLLGEEALALLLKDFDEARAGARRTPAGDDPAAEDNDDSRTS